MAAAKGLNSSLFPRLSKTSKPGKKPGCGGPQKRARDVVCRSICLSSHPIWNPVHTPATLKSLYFQTEHPHA